MRLPVVTALQAPWYAKGLRFTCSQCGGCCTGGPGFVWISTEEIARLADYLKLTPEQVIQKYCRKLGGQISLNENRHPVHGGYDCCFLIEQTKTVLRDGQSVAQSLRVCSIYPVRPLQCRTWPFWTGNLANPEAWSRAAGRCPGMNHGECFDQGKIDELKRGGWIF